MERRPLDVTLICGYFVLLSAVLLGMILWALFTHRIHSPWQDQIFVLPVCFLIALMPVVLALGLWVQDNAARLGGIVFVLLHTGTEIVWFTNPHIPSRAFTVFRIALNLAIIFCLSRPGVRRAFRWKPVGIELRDRG